MLHPTNMWCLLGSYILYHAMSIMRYLLAAATAAAAVHFLDIIDAFSKLRIATISFIVSVRPSVRLEELGSH